MRLTIKYIICLSSYKYFKKLKIKAVIQFSFDIGCPYFGFLQKVNQTQLQEFLKTRDMCFSVFSLAALLSYAIFLLCVIVSKRKDSALVSPSLSLAEDVDRTEIVLLFLASVVIVASFSSATVLYVDFHFELNPLNDSVQDALITATAVVVFLAHWASVNTCHVFAVSSLTLGKFNLLYHLLRAELFFRF